MARFASRKMRQPDCGASLEGDDRKTYDAVVEYCRSRFYHLPVAYILEL